MTAFQPCEPSYHVSVIVMRSWPFDRTQISSSSCLFPMLSALAYRHLREELKHAGTYTDADTDIHTDTDTDIYLELQLVRFSKTC